MGVPSVGCSESGRCAEGGVGWLHKGAEGARLAGLVPWWQVQQQLAAAGGKAAEVGEAALRLIVGELRAEAAKAKRDADEKEAKRRKRAAEEFGAMLRKHVDSEAPWAEVRVKLAEREAFAGVEEEGERERLYAEHCEELRARLAEGEREGRRSKKEKKDKREKGSKKGKRSKRRSSDDDSDSGGRGRRSKRSRSRSDSDSHSGGKRKRRDSGD